MPYTVIMAYAMINYKYMNVLYKLFLPKITKYIFISDNVFY